MLDIQVPILSLTFSGFAVGFLEAVFTYVLFHSIPGGLIGSVASIFCTPTLFIRSFSFLPSKDLIFLS